MGCRAALRWKSKERSKSLEAMTPDLSLIVPMHNEEAGIATFAARIQQVLGQLHVEYEILCIDDGSKDGTYAALTQWRDIQPRVKIIRLSRNFGKEAALTAGLDHASGKAVIPIDADLQDPPELMLDMVAKWREGFKVVLAVRKSRRYDSFFKRLTARGFYGLMRRISAISIPPDSGDFRLMDRQVVEAIKRLPERTRFMKGIFAWAGFSTATVEFERPERFAGSTSWNYRKLWNFALDGIFSFSTLPLRIWTYLGMFISLMAFFYAGFLIVRTIIQGADVPGYASMMTAFLFMGGIQLMSLGILGEYVGRIYRETKQRPIYIVESAQGIEL